MKKAITGIFLATFVAVGAFAQTQDQGITDQHKGRHRYDMAQQLNLSDDQKTQLKTINDDYKQQMESLKKNEDITVREWKSKMTTIRKEHHEKIQNLLTDEQKASLKTIKKDHKSGMRKHGGGHRLERMKKDLNLTDDQVSSIKKNHEEMGQKFKAIREDKSLTDEQKKAQYKDLKTQEHESLKSILTPEQLQKLDQHRKNSADRKGRGLQS